MCEKRRKQGDINIKVAWVERLIEVMGLVKTAKRIREKKGQKKISEVDEVRNEVIHIQGQEQ